MRPLFVQDIFVFWHLPTIVQCNTSLFYLKKIPSQTNIHSNTAQQQSKMNNIYRLWDYIAHQTYCIGDTLHFDQWRQQHRFKQLGKCFWLLLETYSVISVTFYIFFVYRSQESTQPAVQTVSQEPEVAAPVASTRAGKDMTAFLQKLKDAAQSKPFRWVEIRGHLYNLSP